MHVPKKAWVKPELRSVDLARVRALILEAIRVLETEETLDSSRDELRSILDMIERLEDR